MTREQELKILELYLTKVEELLTCRLLKTKHQVSFKLEMHNGVGSTTTTTPDEEDLRSFLLVFRNFYSPKEKINFLKVSSILQHLITDVAIESNISKTHDVYQDILDRSPMALVENQTPVSPEETMRRWMYGFYHHTDEGKRQKIEAWGFAAGLTKTQFVSTLFDLTKCIVWLGDVTKQYLDGKTS